MLMLRHIKEGGAPHKCWNLGPQLPCYATGRGYAMAIENM